MGEGFLRKRAQRFKHQCDAAYDKLKVPTLLTAMRPDIFSEEFTCQLAGNDGGVEPGSSVTIMDCGDDGLSVLAGNQTIAHVCADDMGELKPLISQVGGMLDAEVQELSGIGKFFTVRLRKAG